MVNGRVVNSTHRLLMPGDIVEPTPRAKPLFKAMMMRRLANNTFVLKKDRPPTVPAGPKIDAKSSRGVIANFDHVLHDGAAVSDSYRRLPPPRDASSGGEAAEAAGAVGGGAPAGGGFSGRTQQSSLDAIVPAVLASLAGDGSGLAAEVTNRRPELRVHAPEQRPGKAAPKAVLAWDAKAGSTGGASTDAAKALLTLDRVALRRLMLGLLALRPATSGGS